MDPKIQSALDANYLAGRRHQMILVQDRVRIHLQELANASNPTTELEIVQQKIVRQFLDSIASLSGELR